jgi:hypothetical protein
MGNQQGIISITSLFQDIELTGALAEFKNDPVKLQQFLQNQQSIIYNDVIKQKNNTFDKVYGDLNRASKAQESVLMYNKRNKELSSIQDQVYNNQANMATAALEDKNIAGRKNEMNEWSIGNKNDTLFVFSALFIMLSGLLLATVLWKMGIISSYLCAALAAPLIIIFVSVVVNRSQYTDVLRDKRYWNKKNFGGKYGKIPVPMCPGLVDSIQKDIEAVTQYSQKAMQNVAMAGAQSLQAGANAIASSASALSQSMPQSMPQSAMV